VLIGFSHMLAQYGWIAVLLIVVGAAGGSFYVRSPEGKLQWDHWRLNAWLVGDLMRQLEVARFARTLGALLKGGVPLLEALGTVQGVVGNRLIARAIAQVQVRVREGKGMVQPMTESGLFPPLALHMIAVGQETGRLEGMLISVADHFDQEVKRTTKRLTAFLEPALILGMGLVVGVVVISMLTAIFSINDLPF
jgi:general secretion pathway protein F